MTALLEVHDLKIQLPSSQGLITIVDGIDFRVDEGQVLGLAGESGSGKTMTALALLQLLPARAVLEGTILYKGTELIGMGRDQLRGIRGREISMVFQDPMTSLHPMLTVGRTLTEHLRYHLKLDAKTARARAIEVLMEVQIPDPEGSLTAFPHQFSGGMRQRIAIAGALICSPKLLIADEPTTALDVTVQAGIIRLLDKLREDRGLSVIFVTHDLAVMSSIADRLAVMYAGRLVEVGAAQTVLEDPCHPYTRGLIAALPNPEGRRGSTLVSIPGMPPSPVNIPRGCSFHPRCGFAIDSCRLSVPELEIVSGREVACPVIGHVQDGESDERP